MVKQQTYRNNMNNETRETFPSVQVRDLIGYLYDRWATARQRWGYSFLTCMLKTATAILMVRSGGFVPTATRTYPTLTTVYATTTMVRCVKSTNATIRCAMTLRALPTHQKT